MSQLKDLLDREARRIGADPDALDAVLGVRDRRQRHRRFRAAALALLIFVAGAAWFAAVWRGGSVPADKTRQPVSIDWDRVPGVSIDGDAFVDIRTGEVTPLPASITSFRDPGGYAVAPRGDVLLFEASAQGVARRPCGAENSPERDCQLFVANVDGTDLRQLTDAPEGAMAGGWSPDGTTIVALLGGAGGHRDVDLVLLDVATGETRQLADGGDFSQPHFSRDGQLVLFGRYAKLEGFAEGDFHTFGIPVDGGDAAVVFEERNTAFFSPDGRTIAYSELVSWGNMGGPQVWLADADGSRPRPLVLVPDDEWPFSFNPSWSPDGTRLVLSKPLADAGDLVAVVDVASGTPTFSVRTTSPPWVQPAAVWLDDDTLLVDFGPAGFF